MAKIQDFEHKNIMLHSINENIDDIYFGWLKNLGVVDPQGLEP